MDNFSVVIALAPLFMGTLTVVFIGWFALWLGDQIDAIDGD